MDFVLKNPCQQLCSFSLAPCHRSYACPMAARAQFVLKNSCQQLCILTIYGSLPMVLSPKLFPTVSCPSTLLAPFQHSSLQAISHGFLSVHDVHASVSLRSNGALPKPFPTVSCPSTMSRSLPTKLSPSYFQQFPIRPRCPRFPLPSCSLRFPARPRCSHFHLGFLYLPPNSSPHELFPTVSFPSMMSTLPSRSPRHSKLNENPSIRDAFGEKITSQIPQMVM